MADRESNALSQGDDARKNWREFNALRAEVRGLRSLVHQIQGQAEWLRQRPGFQGVAGGGGTVKQCSIVTILDDYLVVLPVGETATFNCALPWKLRRAGWHGASHLFTFAGGNVTISYFYTGIGYRTATVTSVIPNSIEYQALIPIYRQGDIIYAMESKNDTGIAGVSWLDLNVDARAWARI